MTEIGNDYKKESYYGVGSFILELLKIFFLAFIIIIPVRVFLFQPFFVQGASMEPNFKDSQYLIINEFGYKETKIELANRNFFTIKPMIKEDLRWKIPIMNRQIFLHS